MTLDIFFWKQAQTIIVVATNFELTPALLDNLGIYIFKFCLSNKS